MRKFRPQVWVLTMFYLVMLSEGKAQVNVQWVVPDSSQQLLQKEFGVENTYLDSSQFFQLMKELIQDLHNESYLEASLDSLVRLDSNLYKVVLHMGKPYRWLQIEPGNIPKNWLAKAGFREKLFRKRLVNFPQLKKIQNSLLEVAEDNGFPFAKVYLEDISISPGNISASFQLNRDSLILIDGLVNNGDVLISSIYLENYLGIKTNSLYSRTKILRIKDRVKELPFLQLDGDPTITFLDNRARINLSLKKKRSSKFDFIIGVLPNNAESGRLLITGNFMGEMINQFGKGERIFASFEQLRPQTQELELQFNYPYLLDLPFGVDVQFNLYRRDTTFLNTGFDMGVQYLMEGGNYIKAFWNNRSSNLLSVDEEAIRRTQTLPENLDFNNALFGLELLQQKLDYRYNPRSGWSIYFKGGAGTKKIKVNNTIESLDIEGLYDTIQLRSAQYQIDTRLEAYLPTFSRSTIKFGFRGGALLSDNPIYKNEQYRIGGNQILRGFDEESIFATTFGVFTTEYRLLIGQNSYLYTFGDLAYVEDKTFTNDFSDQIFGFGAGITFETSVGLFALSLAYGSQQNNPIDFSTPKLHFGYVSLF